MLYRSRKTGPISGRLAAILGLAAALLLLLSAELACRPQPATTPPSTTGAGGTGILNLADTGPITLDPAVAAEATSAFYIVQLFSGLVRLDENLEVAPDITESWDKSADGLTFTFHLRPDARFHDGRLVRAGDFKYSWERALNPATRSLTATTYLGDIVGAMDVASGRSRELSGVQVVDDRTLRVTIDGPKAYFLEKLSYPTAYVVERSNVESGAGWWQKPIGTGPFTLKQWQKDTLLVLERNATFYGERAKVSQVVFKLWSGSSLQLYQNGQVDVTFVGSDFMGVVTDPNNPLSREHAVYLELSFSYIGFNATVPPFDDANVRRAFSYAVDKGRLADLSAGGIVEPAYGVLPPGMPGYDPGLVGLRFDPVKAKEAISASTYGDVSKLPPIVLTTSGWGGNISGVLGGVIEEWRRNLGVEVTVRQLEPEFFLYALKEEKDQLYDLGWIADYPDPQDFLDVLFRTGSENNAGEYSNPQLDALLDRAAVEQDPVARLDMYRQAERIVVQDAATLPLFSSRSHVLVKPYVKGYALTPLGYPLLNLVRVER